MRALPVLVALLVGWAGCGANYTLPIDARMMGGDGDGVGSNPGGTAISFTLNDLPSDPSLFSFVAAYQDGDGPWMPAPTPVTDQYSFTVTSPTWGFAYTCESTITTTGTNTQSERDVVTYRFAVAEHAGFTATLPPRCTDQNMNFTLSGTVQNRKTTGAYIVHYNGRTSQVVAATGAYSLQTPMATADLIVVHATDGGNKGDLIADSVFVQRAFPVTATTTQNINGNTFTATTQAGVTVNGTVVREVAATVLYTMSGTTADLVHMTKAPLKTESLGAAQVAATDVYEQEITVSTTAGQSVTTTNATATPAAETYTMPAALGAATVTSAGSTPYPRLTTSWSAYPGAVGYTLVETQSSTTAAACNGLAPCVMIWTAALGPGAAGTSPTYTMPDLSGIAGWNTDLQLVAGTSVNGTVTAVTSSAGATDYPVGIPAAGTTRVFASAEYSVTP